MEILIGALAAWGFIVAVLFGLALSYARNPLD